MVRYEGETFSDQFLNVEGKVFANCTFLRCRLRADNELAVATFSGCVFRYCVFEGEGWPARLINKTQFVKKEGRYVTDEDGND